ncbi:MAG: hypothetical protein ABI690_28415 [Chloroflexota bacterium]
MRVNGGVEKIVAAFAGGKHGKRRQVENFVGEKSAGSTRSAAEWAKTRRE